ncbi:MAG: Holliday junction branch migration protein RuvA [bacterium]|nr:Holliday junction branch migration protein RuvA [bacterium]
MESGFYFCPKTRYAGGVMIISLEGAVRITAEKFAVVEVSGVGYKVFASADTLQKLPAAGERVRLWTHEVVREDARDVYGFLHFAELEFFEMLISVSGIGPKGALGVFGVAPLDTLKRAIAAGDASYLTRVSGIGKKTAEKIVLELREKMAGKGVMVEAPELQGEADALEALISLGYTAREARDALSAVGQEVAGVERRIGAALKKLGAGKK